jgi:hypothetical protein
LPTQCDSHPGRKKENTETKLNQEK